MKRILITGATGYIGRRLFEKIESRKDIILRLMVRNKNKLPPSYLDKAEVVQGDTFDQESLSLALNDVDTAYYLIHSMGKNKSFGSLDRKSAENFRDACLAAGVRRIIYLGGLGIKETASKHLMSRIETGEVLSSKKGVQTIWFRAGVIIGSGSASFEIISNLVQKLPLMITPTWVNTRTQPISVANVLSYLAAALDVEEQDNVTVDIGSAPMSFRDMMAETAKVMGLKRFLLPVPVLTPRLSSYWLILFTPIPYQMAAALVDGLKSETLVLNDNAVILFPEITPQSYKEAVETAAVEMEKNLVLSRWCDSSSGIACDIQGHGDTGSAILRDVRVVEFETIHQQKVFQEACSIGGENGWFTYDFLWKIRGLIDKLSGGYGLNRGRRAGRFLRVAMPLIFGKWLILKRARDCCF